MTAPQSVVDFWVGQGAPLHVAQGIADAVGGESGGNPDVIGDSGTSGGLYQEHATRFAGLKAFAAQQGKPWTDPEVQNQWAASEAHGGDPTAAARWQEILAAPDRQAARALWSRYFERPAATSSGSGAASVMGLGSGFGAMRGLPADFGTLGSALRASRAATGREPSSAMPRIAQVKFSDPAFVKPKAGRPEGRTHLAQSYRQALVRLLRS